MARPSKAGSRLRGRCVRPCGARTAASKRWIATRPAGELFEANALDAGGRSWTYLSSEPFTDPARYARWVEEASRSDDPLFFALLDAASGRAVGVASYLRISPEAGSIEIGNIHFSERMKQSPIATEAMFLLMRNAFALGYRRYEWKCDSLNAPSRAAAARLGFAYEGIFRQALVYKARSRDTAWYSIIDGEWPALEAAFRRWLASDNFGHDGTQRLRLSELTAAALAPLRKTSRGT